MIGKTDHPVRVRNVEILRIRPGRIKSDAEWLTQSTAVDENLVEVGLAVAIRVAQDADLIAPAFGHEEVAIRRSAKETRITQPAGVFLDLKTGQHVELRTGWARDHTRPVVGGSGVVRRREIGDRYLATDPRRVARPIAHRRFPAEEFSLTGRGRKHPAEEEQENGNAGNNQPRQNQPNE